MSATLPDAVPVLSTALLGGLAALDNTAAFQLMLGQPVLAGTAAGALAGDPLLGLETGLTLQLLWSGSSPLGASRFPDAPVGGSAGGAVAALLATGSGVPAALALAWGLLTGLLAAEGGWWTVSRMRRANARLLHRADLAAERGDAGALLRANLAGALASFGRGLLATLAAVLLGVASGGVLFGTSGGGAVLAGEAGSGLPAAILGLRLLGIGVLVWALASRDRLNLLFLGAGAVVAFLSLPLFAR